MLFDGTHKDATRANDKYFTFEIMASGGLKFAFEDSRDADFRLQETNIPARAKDVWYYLTVAWDYENDILIFMLMAN